MNTLHQNSRRSFLGSLAILSAGAAMGRNLTDVLPGSSANGVKELWDLFCRQNNGRKTKHAITNTSHQQPVACKGHKHQQGDVVFFAAENVLAQPVWIYWSNQQQPADMLVQFFDNSTAQNKIATINRFELEALHRLTNEQNETAVLKRYTSDKKTEKLEPGSKGLHAIQVNVKANNEILLDGHTGLHPFSFKQSLIQTA